MTLGGKVNHEVDVVFRKELFDELAVADVSLHENTAFTVDIVFNRTEISGVGQGIEHHDLHVFIVFILLMKQILHKISADKAGSSCYKIRFHKLSFNLFCS